MDSSELLKKLLIRGLEEIFTHSKYNIIKENLLNNNISMIMENLHFLRKDIQYKIVNDVLVSSNFETFKSEFWKNYIDKELNYFNMENSQLLNVYSSFYVLLNRIKDAQDKVDWFDVLVKLSETIASTGCKVPGFTTVLKWLMEIDSKYLLNLLHRTETKNYPRELKIDLYEKLIKLGLLDNKMARRIRSDSSGELSQIVLQFLFEQRYKYTDDDFKNLITQFIDTKHKWVARFISLNMPLHLVPFLMGLDDDRSIKILENRMNL